jgi:integrase/recombinase XerD
MTRVGQRFKTRTPGAVKPRGGKVRSAEDDPLRHLPLLTYMEAHLEWMGVTGYSINTVKHRRMAIRRFIVWCEERGIADPREINKPVMDRYQRHLFYYRKADGTPLTAGTQLSALVPLKTFFKWLARENFILYNPASELQLPKQPQRLPRNIPTMQEVEAILMQADVADAPGLRDRALLETLYSTGMRRTELVNLKLFDVDLARHIVFVREGKGKRDRVIPIGQRACRWIDKYLLEARPQLLAGDNQSLFLTNYGQTLPPQFVTSKVKRYMEFAGIAKAGSAHLMRHACATHMLENGADIRYIQVMLGHANLQTTEVYTHVSIDKLQQIHAATHPARLKRCQDAQTATAGLRAGREVEALLDALDDEEDE